MFSNPFDSFHNTVAEAKEEREQLDRLLTVSTPRERLLLAGIAVLLIVLAAWLFFGSVARSLTVDGVLVESAENSGEAALSVQALVLVDSELALEVEAGMPAVIELATTDGELEMLGGEVAVAPSVSSPEFLEAMEMDSMSPVTIFHHVEIALDEELDPASLPGREVRIVIDLGRQPPAALFGMRRT